MATRGYGKDAPFPFGRMPEGLNPEEISFTTLYQGGEGPRQAIHAVLHSQAQFDAVFQGFPASPAELNFEKNQVLVVADGPRPTTGYVVSIDAVLYLVDRMEDRPPLLLIAYSESKQGPATGDVVTYPVHVVVTEKLTASVEFLRRS